MLPMDTKLEALPTRNAKKVLKQPGVTYAVALDDVLQQDGVLQGRQVIALHLLLFGQDKKFRDSARIHIAHIALTVLFQMLISVIL